MTLNELVSIYSKAQTADSYGTLSQTRTLIATVYAKTYPRGGDEYNAGDQTEGRALRRFWIHQRSDLVESNIIVWNGLDFNIRLIADNGPLEPYMYIDAERGVAV